MPARKNAPSRKRPKRAKAHSRKTSSSRKNSTERAKLPSRKRPKRAKAHSRKTSSSRKNSTKRAKRKKSIRKKSPRKRLTASQKRELNRLMTKRQLLGFAQSVGGVSADFSARDTKASILGKLNGYKIAAAVGATSVAAAVAAIVWKLKGKKKTDIGKVISQSVLEHGLGVTKKPIEIFLPLFSRETLKDKTNAELLELARGFEVTYLPTLKQLREREARSQLIQRIVNKN